MKITKIKKIYQGREASLNLIEVKFQRRKISKEVVIHPNTVAILPLIGKNKIVLVRQYRFPAKKELWEIPAGKLKKKERPQKAAQRELKEETGFKAGKWEKIAEFYNSPGYTTEYMCLLKATHLKKGKKSPDEDELIRKIKIFTLNEALEMIKKKKIVDAKTILAIFNEFLRA